MSGTGPVDLCSIFENGQCFRFEKEPDGSYSGVAVRRFLRVSAGSDSLFLYPCSKEDFEKVSVYIIAPQIGRIRKSAVDLKYQNKIRMYSIENEDFVELIG